MTQGSQKSEQKQRRQRRLGAALRDNLKRRKAQARGRQADAAEADGSPAPTHDSAGFAGEKRNR